MRLEENLLRRMGASTLVDVDDAGIESLEGAVTEANELVEKGDEPGARRLLLAELAAICLLARQARQRVVAADSIVPRRGAYRSSKVVGGRRFCVADQHWRVCVCEGEGRGRRRWWWWSGRVA